jgi:hypothetical protein
MNRFPYQHDADPKYHITFNTNPTTRWQKKILCLFHKNNVRNKTNLLKIIHEKNLRKSIPLKIATNNKTPSWISSHTPIHLNKADPLKIYNNNFNETKFQYQLYKYQRLTFNNQYYFSLNNYAKTQRDYLLALINQDHYPNMTPKIFPVNPDSRVRFTLYKTLFQKQNTIIALLAQNRHLLYPILLIHKNYFKDLHYPHFKHWTIQETIVSIFSSFPAPYWSYISHWVYHEESRLFKYQQNKYLQDFLLNQDQLDNHYTSATARRRIQGRQTSSIQKFPQYQSLGKSQLLNFKKIYPYYFQLTSI